MLVPLVVDDATEVTVFSDKPEGDVVERLWVSGGLRFASLTT